MGGAVTQDIKYLFLFSLVLIFPKVLMRYSIPSGITAIFLGLLAGILDPKLGNDQLFRFLSQIGITSLFLFAGLEVNLRELREDRVYLTKYLAKTFLVLFMIAFGLAHLVEINFQEAFIYSLGILTPSAGFILNSVKSYGLQSDQEYWIKSKAISKEIIAIVLLFIALQSDSLQKLLISSFYLGLLLLILPYLFKFFFRFVSPHAPNSEVPLLVALSLISGVISKEIGAYYLLGAFAVGLIGSQFKADIFKKDEESLFDAVANFFTIFLPFYFFYAGLKINLSDFTAASLLFAIVLIAIFVPIRILLIQSSVREMIQDENGKMDVSISLMPTLVFGLVITGILMERGVLPPKYTYALLLYTILTSIIPAAVRITRERNAQRLA